MGGGLETQMPEVGGRVAGMVEAGDRRVGVDSLYVEVECRSRAQAIEDKAADAVHDAPFQNHPQSS